ncbi:MAG: aldehyde dehydrogenase family protein [Aeromicrobium sp.]|nr:aldehyde dehydrogenase family protein [Burkholderiales bacterium]
MSNLFSVRNPRTGENDYTFPILSPVEINEIATQLRGASAEWSAVSPEVRSTVLGAWRDQLRSAREELIAALIHDTGRKRESLMEFDAALAGLSRWIDRSPALLAEPSTRESIVKPMTMTPSSVPLGLVAVISPWNFPLLLALIDAVPALAAGCTLMVKPSELTPRFVEPLRKTIEAVPELQRVLRFVQGDANTGAAMIDVADAVCFTGSVATGRVIARHCAERLIPVFLELGGKDAAIVLDGADIPRAARAIAWGGLANAGQSCLSIERVIVEARVYPEFVEALVAEVKQLRLAWPDVDEGEIGPMIAARQANLISGQLDEAIARGARALVGGEVVSLGGGLWCQPTVLVDVTPDMRIMSEETFGPVLPVMRCGDAKHALALANGTEFGLSGAVFGSREQALAVAAKMECGAVSVNDAALTAIVHDGEKQAFKHSGLGASRMGDSSIARFRRRRVLIENEALTHNAWWFSRRA